MEITTGISIFVLAVLVGFEVISKIPTTLHTPMMSGTNSIHGAVLIGAIISGVKANNIVGFVLAFITVAFAAMNVFGGYAVTNKLLEMFKPKQVTTKNKVDAFNASGTTPTSVPEAPFLPQENEAKVDSEIPVEEMVTELYDLEQIERIVQDGDATPVDFLAESESKNSPESINEESI